MAFQDCIINWFKERKAIKSLIILEQELKKKKTIIITNEISVPPIGFIFRNQLIIHILHFFHGLFEIAFFKGCLRWTMWLTRPIFQCYLAAFSLYSCEDPFYFPTTIFWSFWRSRHEKEALGRSSQLVYWRLEQLDLTSEITIASLSTQHEHLKNYG